MAENKIIYTIQVNTNESVKSVKLIKDELKSVKTALEQTAQGSSDFNKLNEEFNRLKNELKNVGVQAGSLTAIKNEIKQITQQLGTVKINSPEYNALVQKLGEARAELKDFKEQVQALDPGEKFKAIVGLSSNVAAGFNLASGALKLFGQENEDVEKAIQQTITAMQIFQSIQGLVDSKKNFDIVQRVLGWKQTAAATNEATTALQANDAATKAGVVSFRALKAAIVATGIGILVVGIGEIIANWDKLKASFGNFAIFKSLGNIVDETKQRFVGAFYGIVNGVSQTITAFKSFFDFIKGDASFDDVKNNFASIKSEFEKGFDYGTALQKDRDAAAERKKLFIEQTQAAIENNTRQLNILEASGADTFALRKRILEQELSLLDKGGKDYLDKQNEIDVLIAQRKRENADNAIKEAERLAKEKAKAEADAEKKAKEEAEADKDAESGRKGQFEKEYADQLAAIELRYSKEKLLILQNAKDKEEANKRIKELEANKLNEINELNKTFYADNSAQVLETEIQLQNQRLELIQASADEEKRIKDEAKQKEQELNREIEAQENELRQAAQQLVFDQINQAIDQQYQNEVQKLDNKAKQELAIIDKQLKAGLISEDQAAKKKKEIEDKYEKEKRKAARKAAQQKQIASLAEVAINTAIAITQAYAQLGPVAGTALVPLMIANGAIQAASILAQPLPELNKGGVINAQAGKYLVGSDVKGTSTSDSNLALLSKGEAVINARSVAMPGILPLLSRINELGGGVAFRYASGGLNQFTGSVSSIPQFDLTNTTVVDNSRVESLLERLINQQYKAYVVSSEMTAQQQSDSVIEGRASF